jgi:hypothetical protein
MGHTLADPHHLCEGNPTIYYSQKHEGLEEFGRQLKECNEGLSKITEPRFLSSGRYAPFSSQSYQDSFQK